MSIIRMIILKQISLGKNILYNINTIEKKTIGFKKA